MRLSATMTSLANPVSSGYRQANIIVPSPAGKAQFSWGSPSGGSWILMTLSWPYFSLASASVRPDQTTS